MVALAVVAIALLAGIQASNALVRTAQRQDVQWLAQVCAENELARLRLSRQLPDTGETESTCDQLGRAFRVRLRVQPTPNPNFRRVDADVETLDEADTVRLLTLSTVTGRF
ncbi:type II secretion system protein GspI [Hydrogenophaga sp. NFH-34]|uniref:type II secretion system protein GspI n=1 Tax=Hydrogenophaga sp. NFH-34 TaxID=2744446 RepID=UPI001F3749AE